MIGDIREEEIETPWGAIFADIQRVITPKEINYTLYNVDTENALNLPLDYKHQIEQYLKDITRQPEFGEDETYY